MSIDISRLECVHGEPKDASKVIATYLAKRGLAPFTAKEVPRDGRAIHLARVKGWLVVIDSDPFATDAWAEVLSRALGVTGISMLAHPDFGAFSIHRYDSGKSAGELVVDESTTRSRDGWLKAKVPFLADLAPAKARAQLRSGLDVGVLTDAMIVAIARAAGLPEPRDKYQGPPKGAMRLAFVPAAKKATKPKVVPGRAAAPVNPFGSIPDAPRVLADVRGPSAEDLIELEAFADEMLAEAPRAVASLEHDITVQERATAQWLADRQAKTPPLPGELEDDSLDNYCGRAVCVGRVQWDGDFSAVEKTLFEVVTELADALPTLYGDDDIQVDLRPLDDDVPIRVGGPLAKSTSAKGVKQWKIVREQLRTSGGDLRLGWSLVHLHHAPYRRGSRAAEDARTIGYEPCPIALEWQLPQPADASRRRKLATVVDAVLRKCVRSKHLVEAITTAQEHAMDLAYPRMAGVWAGIRKRAWYRDHVASPGWRVFVPRAAGKKLRSTPPSQVVAQEQAGTGGLLVARATDPFAMTVEAMNAFADYLLPAIGTKKELSVLEKKGGRGTRPRGRKS